MLLDQSSLLTATTQPPRRGTKHSCDIVDASTLDVSDIYPSLPGCEPCNAHSPVQQVLTQFSLCLQFAKQLLAKGNRVLATARKPDAATGLQALQQANPDSLRITQLDTSSPESIRVSTAHPLAPHICGYVGSVTRCSSAGMGIRAQRQHPATGCKPHHLLCPLKHRSHSGCTQEVEGCNAADLFRVQGLGSMIVFYWGLLLHFGSICASPYCTQHPQAL